MVNSISKSFRKAAFLLSQVFVAVIFLSTSSTGTAQDLDVPYVPTPEKVVERMLDLVDVQPSDYVIDLGSGDGRIVIAAAKRGANGHGIDLDPKRISEARKNATKAGVDDQIMFMEGDIFETDFSEASIITMYLLPSVNRKLRPVLLDKLTPGTQIVSHSFDMGDWKPDKEVIVNNINGGGTHEIYYWIIPAKVEGKWTWKHNGSSYSMDIRQNYQDVTVNISDDNGSAYDITKAKLQGPRLTIQAQNGNKNYIFSGRVEQDTISGMMQNHNGNDKTFTKWSATK